MTRFSLVLLSLCIFTAACTPDKLANNTDKKDEATQKSDNNYETAENLKKNGQLQEAAKIYENLARENTSAVEAEIELAAIDRKLGRADEAVEIMKDALKRQPDNQNVSVQLGYALIDAKHFEEAVTVFDGLLTADPQNVQAYSGKAIAFDKSGNHLAAQELYKQALKISPDNMSVQNNLAMSLILNNQLTQAIPLLEKLNHDFPDHKTIRHNLALAYGLTGEAKRAYDLNVKDLTIDQARENDKFYHYYMKVRKDLQSSNTPPSMTVGFTETPEDKKTIAVAVGKPPKPVLKKAVSETVVAVQKSKPLTPEEEVAAEDAKDKTELEAKAAPIDPDASTNAALVPAAGPEKSAPEHYENEPVMGTVLETSGETAKASSYPATRRH